MRFVGGAACRAGEASVAGAWRALCRPGDVIGLVPSPHLNPTHDEVVDALRPLWSKGPQPDPRSMWPHRGIIAGADPVAVETVSLPIIETKRAGLNGAPWPLSPPVCVRAADEVYGLRTSTWEEITLERIDWEGGRGLADGETSVVRAFRSSDIVCAVEETRRAGWYSSPERFALHLAHDRAGCFVAKQSDRHVGGVAAPRKHRDAGPRGASGGGDDDAAARQDRRFWNDRGKAHPPAGRGRVACSEVNERQRREAADHRSDGGCPEAGEGWEHSLHVAAHATGSAAALFWNSLDRGVRFAGARRACRYDAGRLAPVNGGLVSWRGWRTTMAGKRVVLRVNGRDVRVNEFVSRALAGTVEGFISALDDVPQPMARIEIVIQEAETPAAD